MAKDYGRLNPSDHLVLQHHIEDRRVDIDDVPQLVMDSDVDPVTVSRQPLQQASQVTLVRIVEGFDANRDRRSGVLQYLLEVTACPHLSVRWQGLATE